MSELISIDVLKRRLDAGCVMRKDAAMALLDAVVASWLVDRRSERLGGTERTEEEWDDLIRAFDLKCKAFARFDFTEDAFLDDPDAGGDRPVVNVYLGRDTV